MKKLYLLTSMLIVGVVANGVAPRCYGQERVSVLASSGISAPSSGMKSSLANPQQLGQTVNNPCDMHHRHGIVRFAILLSGIATSVWDDGTVSMAIPLENSGDIVASNVEVTRLDVPGGSRLEPLSLPEALGEILPKEVKVVPARFELPQVGPQFQYPVNLRVQFKLKHASCHLYVTGLITPEPRSNEDIPSKSGIAQKFTADTAVFGPPPTPQPPGFEFNGDFNNVSIVPLGPPRNFFITPPGATSVSQLTPISLNRMPAKSPRDQRAGGLVPVSFRRTPPAPQDIGPDPNSVVFTRNTLAATFGGFPPDPSVAGADNSDVVLATANTAIFFSTDGGKNFTGQALVGGFNDPAIPGRTSFFPEDDGGLCCDQVLTYVPSRNLYVWLLQYKTLAVTINLPFIGPITVTLNNRLRIAWATPQAVAADFLHAWTWADLTSAGVNIGIDWMDYPDLAFSNNFLYVGVDHGIFNSGQVHTDRHIFVRMSLDDMANPNVGSVGYQFMDPQRGGLWQNHIVQSSGDTMYWTAFPDTSTLSLFTWSDSSNSASVRDIGITSYNNSDYSAPGPDGIDWNAAPKNALGATRVDPSMFCPPTGCVGPTKFLYFAFSAGRDNSVGRPFPYIRVEKIDPDGFNRLGEVDIWNPGFAFSTPAFVSRPGDFRNDVAMSLSLGGGSMFANNAVGFLNDFVVYVSTDSNGTQAGFNLDKNGKKILDGNGNPTFAVRWGDYYSTRNSVGPPTANGRGVGYSTLGYAVKNAGKGNCAQSGQCSINLHYVQFGRFGDLFPNPPPPPPK